MDFIRNVVTTFTPIFLVSSPVTSYADQIYSIHRARSSAGFSLDIPLIMLVASITKVFFWFGDHFDTTLLIQAIVMIGVQILLLHIALTNRAVADPTTQPFAGATDSSKRPYDFWQWRSPRPYWVFLVYFSLTLAALQMLLGQVPAYISMIGYFALAVEAILPVPQIISNHSKRSCKGFRLSVIVNWLLGDVFKLSFFFLSQSGIPLAFKLCGLFQAACDVFLGIQFVQFGDGKIPAMTGAR